MTMFLEVSPFVAQLVIINMPKLTSIDWSRCRETLGIHSPKHGKIIGCYQCLAQWHVIGAPFGNAGFHMNHAQQPFHIVGIIAKQYIGFIRNDTGIVNPAQERGFFGFAAYLDG